MTDILKRLLASFKQEHGDHLENIRATLAVLVKTGQGPGPELEEAFRRAHSLKGAARAVDLNTVETLAHCVETIFSRIREGALPLDKKTIKTIHLVLDAIEDWVAAYFKSETLPDPVQALEAATALLGTQIKPKTASEHHPQAQPAPHQLEEVVAVDIRALERLQNASDQMFTEVLSNEIAGGMLSAAEFRANEIEATWNKVKRSRGRNQTHHESIERNLRILRRQLRDSRVAHERANWSLKFAGGQLREEVLLARMVPVETVFHGFRKMVRDIARDEKKEVDYQADGLSIQADRLVLNALKDPVMHLLRNAINHGIESPDERRKKGKEPIAAVSVRLQTQGNRLNVSIRDDGRGVDWKAAADVAIRRRYLSKEQAVAASRDDLSKILFQPGFSTAPMVTDLAGRGMGLSVVAEAVKRLQGTIDLQSPVEDKGTTISISVPLSISTHRLILLRLGDQTFAIPASAVERMLRMPLKGVETMEGKPIVRIGERPVPLVSLGALLGLGDGSLAVEGDLLQVIILKGGRGGLAVTASEFLTEVPGIIKNLTGGAEKAKCFRGAILMADGTPVLVLDPEALIENAKRIKVGPVVQIEKTAAAKKSPMVLVVDDSITTRTLEKSILEAHGYQVLLAVDGEEGLQKLKVEAIDLVIVDVQMPRMNGFEMIAEMKKNPSLSKVPVIIVTSLESDAEKERGLTLGADAYIVKRKFDHKGLLETISQIL